MKKNFILLFLSIGAIFFILTGCFSDPVKDDLEDYVNNGIMPLAEDEDEIISLYESVTGINYIDDFILYETIHLDIIPKYQVFIDDLEAIRPETREVRDIHEVYIQAHNTQYNAMVIILDALDYQDHGLINNANENLNEARTLFRNFLYDLEDLLDEHNLEMEYVTNSMM
ncbi:hypothetical protein QA612_17970 [Evansella sp. AB-P1]|uniref:hypothetical protein n=1 Tax=Evansella sp. AB-P1 TaxID=3037653 RepID=UPI00241F54C6|nr:hypothetical protein [Evansella sp. AB-P1]MDG5789351.1 hypothetical protein [Evansella sp. AB-P1]